MGKSTGKMAKKVKQKMTAEHDVEADGLRLHGVSSMRQQPSNQLTNETNGVMFFLR